MAAVLGCSGISFKGLFATNLHKKCLTNRFVLSISRYFYLLYSKNFVSTAFPNCNAEKREAWTSSLKKLPRRFRPKTSHYLNWIIKVEAFKCFLHLNPIRTLTFFIFSMLSIHIPYYLITIQKMMKINKLRER